MTNKYNYLIAKTEKTNKKLWLPLFMHLRDTAEVMKKIINLTSVSVINATGMTKNEFRKTAIFLAGVHDIGKATSYFQNIITKEYPERFDKLNAEGFTVNRKYLSQGKTPHAYAGQWILTSEKTPFKLERTVADVIGSHHGKPIETGTDNDDLLANYPINFYGKENNKESKIIWIDCWKRIITDALKYSGYKSINEINKISVEAQIILSGLLIEADWIASNSKYFPLIDYDNRFEDFEKYYPERIKSGWNALNFPEPWESQTDSFDENIFKKTFGFLPNKIQSAFIDIINKSQNPGIFILEAPMGCGKTEVALSAAEVIAGREDEGGIFFGMPTQATSNGIFGRLLKWAEYVSEDTIMSIKLAHGAAELNEDYNKLIFKGNSNVDEDENADEDKNVVVHSWFSGSKKALLSDFVIGTVDQFLLATLKRKHFMLRHLGLVGKVVIIDECHAYDTYMMSYLKRSIEWMAAYKIPVILLSATLPNEKRKDLINSYVKIYTKLYTDKNKPEYLEKNWDKTDLYPVITYSDGYKINQINVNYKPETKNIFIKKINNINSIIDILNNKLSEGGTACVIANTVKSAQKIYDEIKNNMQGYNVLLYHAGFIMSDRSEKEKQLLLHMGKNSTRQERDKFILVGTQVLEQSLDYDADVMITQLCPMDLLLQRIGRLHRHKRNNSESGYDRPEKCKVPECFILEDDDKIYDDGTKAVYGNYLLMRTNAILKETIVLPTDISPLVQKAYDFNDELGLSSEEYLKAKEDFETEQNSQKQKSKNYLLSKPTNCRNIENILRNKNTDDEKNIERSVRDSSGFVEVLVLKLDKNNNIYTFDGLNQFDINSKLTHEQEMIISRQKLRLPAFFAKNYNISQTIDILENDNINMFSIWQQSPMIHGELIMLFDENGNYKLKYNRKNDKQEIYILHYDINKGIEFERESDADE